MTLNEIESLVVALSLVDLSKTYVRMSLTNSESSMNRLMALRIGSSPIIRKSVRP